jgi:hypothetical protein
MALILYCHHIHPHHFRGNLGGRSQWRCNCHCKERWVKANTSGGKCIASAALKGIGYGNHIGGNPVELYKIEIVIAKIKRDMLFPLR